MLIVAADAAGQDRAFALALDDGSLVPVTGDLDERWANARVSARVRVPTGTGLRTATSPLGVSDVRLVGAEAAPAAAEDTAHQVYVARPTNVGGYTLSTAQVLAQADVVAAFWEDEANGAISDLAVPATVTTYTTGFSAATVCSLGQFFPMVDEAAALFPDAEFFGSGATDVLVVVTPDIGCATSTLGVGSIGRSFASGGASVTRASSSYLQSTLAHEMGHNFGLQHSNVGTLEYHDIYNVMGFGIAGAHQLTALSTAYRLAQEITDPGEVEALPVPDPGQVATLTRTLAPRSDESGLRSLTVTSPDTGETYLVDYRSGTGQDAGSPYAGGYSLAGMVFRPGVVVEQVEEYSVGSGVSLVRDPGGRVAAVAGDTWTSPGGAVTVTVGSMTPTGAQVTVTYTPTTAAPSPEPAAPPAAIPLTSTPVVSGVAQVGRTLVASTGAWSPGTVLTWQWQADGVPIPGATAGSFTPGAAQRGVRLGVLVTGTRPGNAPTSRASVPTAPVTAGRLPPVKPSIAGTPRVGRILTVRPGTWPAGVRLSYRWLADGKAVKGGTGKRLEVTARARGDPGVGPGHRAPAGLPGGHRPIGADGQGLGLRSVRTAP